ncbi:MAG TPA: SpoIVB peptidase [Firmicutes bacterium]|nr:SpoIVB peptidase [Bacillota bacterium]
MNKLKKCILATTFLLSFPINVFAYSDYIIPGGKSIGIEIKTDGILVVGFYKINGKFNKGNPSIKVGDRITKINDREVKTVSELAQALEEGIGESEHITLLRNGKEKTVTMELIEENGTYKTGLYVKDNITGIGTLTYIDPETQVYGALGHNVIETNTNSIVEVKTGTIFRSSITSIDRSVSGSPGGKNAKFYSGNIFGTIEKNEPSGIYGKYTDIPKNKEKLKVADLDEVKEGPAKIYTVLKGEQEEEFSIEITKIDKKADMKNIYFDVTDKMLLEKTGGIVQGMSGSPIIQDGKIIGAVTHVVISNPSSGYGISIKTMLEEGEK